LASVESVLPSPGSKDHFRVVEKIAIDRDLYALDGKRHNRKPFGIGMERRFASGTFPQEENVRHHGRPFPLEGRRPHPARSYVSRATGAAFPGAAIVCDEREIRLNQSAAAAGPKDGDRLRSEKTMERELLANVVEF